MLPKTNHAIYRNNIDRASEGYSITIMNTELRKPALEEILEIPMHFQSINASQ